MILEDDIRNNIVRVAKELNVRKVILFGSRAREDCHSRSDIDLAVEGFQSAEMYFRFREAMYQLPTLLMFDIIDLNSDLVDKNLRDAIEKDGVVLYNSCQHINL